MQILPVIDLKGGVAVHAAGGQRDRYKAVQSVLSQDSQPQSIAAGIVRRLHCREVYVADLDAISGCQPAWECYRKIAEQGVRIWLDAGARNTNDAARVIDWDPTGQRIIRLILGLESLESPQQLLRSVERFGADRIVFSLDLYNGQPISTIPTWRRLSAFEIANHALGCGVRAMIVLDLGQVGTGRGTGTRRLCRQIKNLGSPCNIIAGGGIRSRSDVEALHRLGCAAALVGSAFHAGTMSAADIEFAARLGMAAEI